MDWSIYAIPVATVLGALIGGLVTLRVNATQAQRGIVDEFSKLSSAVSYTHLTLPTSELV